MFGADVPHTPFVIRNRYPRFLPALLCVLTLVGALFYFEQANRSAPRSTSAIRGSAAAPSSVPALSPRGSEFPSDADPRVDILPQSFSRRLRCTGYRRIFGHALDAKAVQLLCDRKPLEALKILSSMAEAGDKHAMTALAVLGHVGGSCNALQPSPTFAQFRVTTMERAEKNGMTGDALDRLREVLSEEQAGPTIEELQACHQSAAEFNRLSPTMLEQFVSTVGQSIEKLRGRSGADVQIVYDRQSLVAGDADGQLNLALELLARGSHDNQDEALGLLREAAKFSPSAKTQSAICFLNGCPIPAPDPREAVQLLTDAALSGDALALRMMSGDVGPAFFDAETIVPASERYAWSTFRQRLNEEGCFGPADYLSWVNFPTPPPSLLAMSPYESSAAKARAAALLAAQLDRTRVILECNAS